MGDNDDDKVSLHGGDDGHDVHVGKNEDEDHERNGPSRGNVS